MGRGLKGLFTGGLLGIVAGILFAPQKGEETRKKVKAAIDTAKEKGGQVVGEIKGKIEKGENE